MKYGELTLGQIEAIVNKLGGMDGMRRFLSGALAVQSSNIYPVSVDYEMSVEELVRLGRYDWSNSDITSKHFPTQRAGKAEVAIELIHFDREIGSDEALRELDRMGYRPAELHELLAFGARYPDVQREFPVIVFGSMWRNPHGNRYVPYLLGDGSERKLYLIWFEDDWSGRCRFAAVRK